MSILEKKLKLAINPDLIDKNEAANRSLFASGWMNVEFTVDDLETTSQFGIAFCAQLTGSRKAENFLACDIASVDVDDGMTLEEALAHPLIKEYALFVYTTHRHTREAHRFRVVFALPRTITEPGRMVTITRALTRKLGGDRAAVDATRISFGNRGAQIYRIGREITDELLRELILDARLPEDTDLPSREIVSRRSVIALAPEQDLLLADGRRMTLDSIPPKTAVHCPIHLDEHASAFVIENRHGEHGLYCSTCSKSYWPSRASPDTLDPDDFVNTAKSIAASAKPLPRELENTLSWSPLSREHITGSTVQIVSGQATPSKLLRGITFVKSDKGSGKTEGMRRLAAMVDRTLLIGHRRTLIRGSCKRLGLLCYLDRNENGPVPGRKEMEILRASHCRRLRLIKMTASTADKHRPKTVRVPPRRDRKRDRNRDLYGICLDSLGQVQPDQGYKLLIIDESEQVLAHLLSDTITSRGSQGRIFRSLQELVRRATYVVVLDADLGLVSYNTLVRMISHKDREGNWQLQKPVHLWINETGQGEPRTIVSFDAKNQLIGDLLDRIAEGKRCFVASNCKKLLVKLEAFIRGRFGDSRRIILITADTGSQAEVQDFVANAKEQAATYDVMLCSPSLGTGVDITFPENAKLVEVVYGFCEHGITTHLDFDQQLHRVRHPGAVKIWISPRRFNFETHPEVVRHDILRAGLFKDLLDGWGDDGKPRFVQDDPLIELAAGVKSMERASKNDLRGNYIRYKQAQGCTIVQVNKNPGLSESGKGALIHGGQLADTELVARIMGASVLPRPDFDRVRKVVENGGTVSDIEKWSYERTRLELFYRAEASEELIRLDRRGGLRQEVSLFQEVTRTPPEKVPADANEPPHQDLSFVGTAHLDLAPTLVRLLRLTPLWRVHPNDGKSPGSIEIAYGRRVPFPEAETLAREGRLAGSLDAEAVFDARDLQAFARFMTGNKGPLENLLRHEVRADIGKKPTQQLGLVLKMLGLKLARAGTVRVSGQKVYRYRLDPSALQDMQQLVATREGKKAWAFLVDRYGSHMDPSDGDDWSEVELSIERVQEYVRKTTRGFS
jgi:hypothetical protein